LGDVGVDHDCQTTEAGDNLTQEFDPLASKFGRRVRQAGDITAWPGETRNEAAANRVRRYRKDDWDDRCRPLCLRNAASTRYNDIDVESNKLRRNLGDALAPPLCPPILNRDVPAVDPTEFAQPLLKGCYP
jgi:hypothetical protein